MSSKLIPVRPREHSTLCRAPGFCCSRTIVVPEGRYRGTISAADGRIAAILEEPSGRAARTIDAEGLIALPGMVDQHVHFMDPGDTAREDFITGSSAAAVGGVTTVIEHAQQPRAHR